ncbi:MAG: hypothetical protein JXR91_08075 [Deltaproteobacteria bacterium]|nr:hypothetical protein [Deltaproteobacteria bacterium]
MTIIIKLSVFILIFLPGFKSYARNDDDDEFDVNAFINGNDNSSEKNISAESSENKPDNLQNSSNSIKLHGIFENQLNLMLLNAKNSSTHTAIYDYVQLRVDLDASLKGDIEIKADGVARLFAGDTQLPIGEVIPQKTIDALLQKDPRFSMLTDQNYNLENDYYLDNAYIKIPAGDVLFTFGKQPTGQGAGYVWNPTDIFTKKDLLDPTYQQKGEIAGRVMIPFGKPASLEMMAVPDGRFKQWSAGGRLNLRLGRISLGAVSYTGNMTSGDFENSMDSIIKAVSNGQNPEDGIIKKSGNRVMTGVEIVADIKGVRLWAEGGYNFAKKHKDWWELTGGGEYFFPFETHIMVEYFHFGMGPVQHNGYYSYNDWMGVMNGDLKMLGRDFLFESIDHPIGDFWTLGLSSFQSFTDNSAIVTGDIHWNFAENADLWLMIAGAIGEKSDFFSSSKGQSWLRLQLFF